MGLLSRLRSRPAAAPASLWRRGDFTVVPLGAEVLAVQQRGRPVVSAPAFLVEFVQECTRFQPLETALALHAESRGWDSLQVAALRALLPQAAADGLLVSTEELRRAVGPPPAESAPPPPLATVGFSTGGDRLHLLKRGVRSFAQNVQSYGRSATFLISENSRDPRQTYRCREALRSWSVNFPELVFRFAGEREKRAFAARLSQAEACSPEVAEFALLDLLESGFSVGANRNALLLQAAGERFASLDDDAICRLAAPPNSEAPKLSCFSETDPFQRWLAGRDEPLPGARWQEADYLGAHEQLLGRTGAELFAAAGEIDFSRTRDALVQRLLRTPARVLATCAGHLGDPGIPTSAYFLYFDGENRERLVESAARYHTVFGSRRVFAISAGLAVGDATVCPGIAMALDHRELLPPFFPVHHAEDYSWGAVLWRTCAGGLLGHLPLAVCHEPGEGKAILTPAQLRAGPPFVLFEFAHLLRQLVLRKTLPEEGDTAGRLRTLGRYLQELGQLAPEDFREQLREQALLQASERIAYLEHELEHHPELPEYWREDVQGLVAHLQHSTTAPDFEIPLDLQSARAPDETRRWMQTLLGRYGELLVEWPGMVEAARGWSGELMPPL